MLSHCILNIVLIQVIWLYPIIYKITFNFIFHKYMFYKNQYLYIYIFIIY